MCPQSRMTLVCLLLVAAFIPAILSLKIGAFNVRVFGPSKASNDNVMRHLSQIAVRYDILLIQEIRDNTGTVVEQLLQQIKKNHNVEMKLAMSDRLGRTSSKEQYAFLYREDRGVSVLDLYHFDDGDEVKGTDLYEREPFVVRFQVSGCPLEDLSLVALHTSPAAAVPEIQALSQVVQNVRRKWGTNDVMILGDLNADCRYVPKKHWPAITIRQNPEFWWPIGDDVDTTVNSNTDCAYDRFIITGAALKEAVLPGSAVVFDFQAKYGLTEEEALEVSDHYPIELTLRDCAPSVPKTSPPAHKTSPASSKASETLSGLLQRIQRLWTHLSRRFSDTEL